MGGGNIDTNAEAGHCGRGTSLRSDRSGAAGPAHSGRRGSWQRLEASDRGVERSLHAGLVRQSRDWGSTIRDGQFTIEAMAADALAIMDAVGLDRVHVAGHSMGGVIAQALALAAPARVIEPGVSLHLCPGKDGSTITLPMLGTALRMRIGTRAQRRNAFLELIMPERYLQQVDRPRLAAELQPLFGHDLADQPPIVMKQLKAMSRFDAGARLNELATVPTLVVSAVEDRIAGRSTGRALATAIPGSRYVEIADAGHGLPIHRAAETNALLDEHWSRAEGHLPSVT